MSNDWIEEEALRFEGFNDQQIAQLKAAIPKAQQLLALVQKNKKDLETIYLLGEELVPVLNMAATVLKARIA